MTSILILCTGNSCRSQMAEGYLKSFGNDLNVFSAGTEPTDRVHPLAVKVMSEIGLDIGSNHPENVDRFLQQSFDYVITVCDHARETCPVFTGKVDHHLHMGFEDPGKCVGSFEDQLVVFREVRDQIKLRFKKWYKQLKEV